MTQDKTINRTARRSIRALARRRAPGQLRGRKPGARHLALAGLTLALAGLVVAVTPRPGIAARVKVVTAGPSKAVTPAIIDAIAAEMKRAAKGLRIPGAEPPYFIGYKVTEVEVNDIVASLGATTWNKSRHFVSIDARVHAGSYQLDNANFVIAGNDSVDGLATVQLPIEATENLARRAAWLATDTAYKEALEQLRGKLDTRNAAGALGGGADSYTQRKPVIEDEPVDVPALEPAGDLEQRARKISEVFRDQPHVRDSRVAFTSFLERRWYLNNEGTRAHDTRRVSGVVIAASGQATDGQELAVYFSRYGHTGADLPTHAELIAEAEKLASTLAALRVAPVMDNYTGPVLFEGMGAAGVVRYSLAQDMGGTPIPQGMSASDARFFGGALVDRIGLRVTSPLLSIVDDPTAARAGKRAIIGGYRFDDEGTPAQRVQVIEDGKLETLLTSRTPSPKLPRSNGHARRAAPGGAFHGSATNLFVTGRRGVSRAALRAQLLNIARREYNSPYALVIRQLDDAAVTAAPELSRPQLIHMLQTTDPSTPPIALLAYKVYPNGREELVRGAQLKAVPIQAWKDVVAVGREPTVFNYLNSGQPNLFHKVESNDGSVPSGGVESAIVTPDLLFRELDVVGSTAGQRPEPAVPSPVPSTASE